MRDQNADDLIRLQEQMQSTRGVLEGHLREVAERVRPEHNDFQNTTRSEGDKRQQKIFDATAPLALPKFAAAVISMTMPATQQYHGLAGPEALKDDQQVKRYYEAVASLLFRVRYNPHANFQSQTSEVILDVGAFGTGVLFIDDVVGTGIRYKSFPLAESYIAEDPHGRVNRVHRKFKFTAQQAVARFGADKVSQAIKTAFEKNPMEKFWFLHTVGDNNEYTPTQKLNPKKSMRFHSCYIDMEARQTVEEGGYRTFPFAVPRYATAPKEVYGRGPGMQVLPDIKMLNEMSKVIIRAGQMVIAPPMMLSDDASLQPFNMRTNALNYGYVDGNGRPMAIPLQTNARVDIGLDLMNQRREAINDAFLVTLFRILVQEPQITATEAMLRAQEKGQLLAPTMGRIQSELLGPVIEREIDILSAAGALPEMPPQLAEYGGEYSIVYQSPLNHAQQAGVGIGILNTFQALAPLLQVDPSIMQNFDIDGAARRVAEVNGFPASLIRSMEEITALKEQAASAAQAQQLLAAAPVAASSAKDLAQAQALAASSPNQAAPQLGL